MMLSGGSLRCERSTIRSPLHDDAVVPQAGQIIVLSVVAHLLAGAHQFPFSCSRSCAQLYRLLPIAASA